MKIKLSKYFKKKTFPDYGRKFNSYKKALNFSENIGEYFDFRLTKFEGPDQVKLIDRFYLASFFFFLYYFLGLMMILQKD